jgi:hypothetical protein
VSLALKVAVWTDQEEYLAISLAREIAISSPAAIGAKALGWSLGGASMPLYWMIDSKERLFMGSGEGDVNFADAMALLDALAGAGALSYRSCSTATQYSLP